MATKYTDKGYKYLPPYGQRGDYSRSGQKHSLDAGYRRGKLAEEKSIRRKKEQIAKKMVK